MTYYNENDPKAAAWLRELIRTDLIPDGHVDERSITEVKSHELTGFTQHHFFAGIGGWAYALRLAGWPDTRPAFTGSCPCQPFSIGSTGAIGQQDARHLWPSLCCLIRELGPSIVFGEQVDAAIGWGWLDEVFSDLELAGYACASAVLPSRAYGTEHWRARLFWVANAGGKGREGREPVERISCGEGQALAKSRDTFANARRAMAGDWSHLPAFDGVSVGMVRSILKGAGNAIVPQVAAEFIQACDEAINLKTS